MIDGTLRRLARGLGALAVLVLLLVGIPIALAVLVGWPLPHGLPSWNEFRSALMTSGPGDEVIVKGLALVCWLAWASLAASVVLEVAGMVRGRGSRRVPFAGPVQALAANLVAAVVLTLPSLGTRTAPSAAQPLAVRLQAPTTSPIVAAAPPVVHDPDQPIALMSATADPANEVAVAEETYTVVRRDTLWGIAEVHLGDPFRWPELFELNRGRPQFDGRTLSEPNLIRPGWVLALPAGASLPTQTARPPTTGAGSSSEAETSTRATIPVPTSPAETSASTTTAAATARPTAQPTKPPDSHPAEKSRSSDGSGIDLPGGSVVGLSLAAGIGASLAAVRLRRRRSRVPRPPEDGIAWDEPLATPAVRRLRRADLAERAPRYPKGTQGDGSSAGRTEQRPAGLAAKVSVGDRAGEQVALDLLATGPVGLAGSGACGVARALVLDFLSNASEHAAEVVVAGPTLAKRLFPGIAPFAGMEIAGDLEAAITRLEVELVHRTRLIDETDDADFASYIEQNPVEPLSALVLMASEVRSGLRLRLDAVASVGGRLGISAVVLDPPPSMAAITIAEGGSVEEVSATPTLSDLRRAQLFSLEPVEAAELLGVVAAGRGAPEPLEGIAEHRPDSFDLEDVPAAGPIAVHLLGTYRIEAHGEEIRTGFRSKARELLAFLLLHPQGKSVEAAVDAIWPDSDLARGAEGFRTAVGNLRKVVRAATQNPKARVIERVGERYRVEPSMFDCDLWRLEDALRDARNADKDADVAAALERATKECAGELLNGAHYEWAETPREDIRRRSLDALARLADVRVDSGDLDAVIAILEDAIRLDPYAEELYRRVMTMQAQLGHHDAARRTYGQLESRLADLDVDPDESSQHVLEQLTEGVRAR